MGYRWKGNRLLSDNEYRDEVQAENDLFIYAITVLIPGIVGWWLAVVMAAIGIALGIYFFQFFLAIFGFGVIGFFGWFFYGLVKSF